MKRVIQQIVAVGSAGIILCSCDKNAPTKEDLAASDAKVEASFARLEASIAEVAKREKAFEEEMAKPVRWATVDGNRVQNDISEWNSRMNSKLRKEPAIPPELAESYTKYLSLSRKLNRMREAYLLKKRQEVERLAGGSMHGGMWMGSPSEGDDNDDPEYQKLVDEVNVMRLKIAPILAQQNVPYYTSKYKKEDLIREYAKGRYDLLVDVAFGRNSMVYSSKGQQIDVTEEVIELFRSKSDR